MSTRRAAPPAPRLAAIRDRWLDAAAEGLRADPAVAGAALIGSLGAGRHDDWSDVDLLVVVDDARLEDYAGPGRLPDGPGAPAITLDARHNGQRGTRAFSQQRIIDGLPLWVDWYVVPAMLASWVADSAVLFDRRGFDRLEVSYVDRFGAGEREPASPQRPDQHRMLQLALVPVAGKRIARRTPETSAMVEFVGGPHAPDATWAEHIATLRRLLDGFADLDLPRSVAAARAYLDLVEETSR